MSERDIMLEQAESLLDNLIESDPDRAERFMESLLARLAVKKRLQAARIAAELGEKHD